MTGPATPRLKTEIRVQAWLRRCSAAGLMAAVARKGDVEAGALFIKLNRFAAGCEVFSGVTGTDGVPAWFRATGAKPVSEKEADAYLARQVSYDSDLWILEIEDPRNVFAFDEPVVSA